MMNERIRQLVKQSGIDIYGLGRDRVKWESCVGEFVELIVRECGEVSLKNSHRSDDMGAIISRQINQHFGVEE